MLEVVDMEKAWFKAILLFLVGGFHELSLKTRFASHKKQLFLKEKNPPQKKRVKNESLRQGLVLL